MPNTLNESEMPYKNFLRLIGFHEKKFVILTDEFFKTGHFSAKYEAFNFLIQFDFPLAEREEMYQKLLLHYQNTSERKSPLEILPDEYKKYRTLTEPPNFFEFSPPFIDPFKRAFPPATSYFNETLKFYKLLNETWKVFSPDTLKLPDLYIFLEEINTQINQLNELKNKSIISVELFKESGLLEENKKNPSFEKMTESLDLAAFEKFKALHPGKTKENVQKEWASYNMGGLKRTEFSVAVLTENAVPEWAEVHKINSMLPENRYRFIGIHQLADQAIKTAYIEQENSVFDPDYFRKNFSQEYLDAYLKTAGYEWCHTNQGISLSRRDIKGVFIATTDTPYQYGLGRKTSDHDPVPQGHDPVPQGEVAHGSSIPHPQKKIFAYLIDTRGLPVVPTIDDNFLNPYKATAYNQTIIKTAYISIYNQNQGIPLHRLWWVNYDGKAAVNVSEMYKHFPDELSQLHDKAMNGTGLKNYLDVFFEEIHKHPPDELPQLHDKTMSETALKNYYDAFLEEIHKHFPDALSQLNDKTMNESALKNYYDAFLEEIHKYFPHDLDALHSTTMDRISLKNDYDALFVKARGKNLTVLDTEPFTVTHPKKLIAFESPFPETSFFEKISANRDHDVRNWGVVQVLLTSSDSVEAKKHIILQIEDDYDSMIKSAQLTGENPNAVWVQMNKKGDYQFYGNLQNFINQEVVLTVVGHIREKNTSFSLANLSLADYSARELVEQLNVFLNKTGVKIKKNEGIFLKNVNPSNNIVEYDRRFKNFEQECDSRIRLHSHLTFNPVLNASNPLKRENPGESEQLIIKKPRAETETGITQDKIRVIFQLENGNDIVAIANILAHKHPSESIVMRYAGGHLLMEGDFRKLKNNITLLLLGHGEGGPNNAQQDNIILGGYNATQLAELIQAIPAKLSEKFHTGITIDKVVLLGCATAGGEPEAPTGLLMDVAKKLEESPNLSKLPQVIVGYSSPVKITKNNDLPGAGHRVLLKADEKGGKRLSLMLNAENKYVPGPEKQKSVAVTDGLLHSGYLSSTRPPETQKGIILADMRHSGSTSPLTSSQKNSMRFFQHSGTAMQAYGYLMLLKQLQWYFRRDVFDSLSEKEKQDFLFQRTLTLIALVSLTSIDASQLALISYQNSAQKIFEKNLRLAQTPTEQKRLSKYYLNQMKWLNRGLLGLNLLSSALDLYLAHDAFSQASNTQDPALCRDLIVSGVLSSASVVLNLGTTVAMALGGTALSAVALPAALIAGAGIMLAGAIYTAVREMEEIQKYVRLTNGERLEGGLRAFLGMRQPAHFINPMMYAKGKEYAQEKHLEELAQYMKRFARSQKGVKHLYYSKTDVVMDNGKFYRVLKGHDRLLSPPQLRATGIPRLGVFGLHNNELMILESDIVDAAKAREILERYKNEKFLGSHRYSDLRIEDSDYKFYTPIGINEKDEPSLDALLQVESVGYQEKVGTFALPTAPQNTSGLTKAENFIPLTQVNLLSTDHRTQMGDFNGDGYKDIFFFSERGSYLQKGNKSGFYFSPINEIKDIPPQCYGPEGGFINPQRWVANLNGVDEDGRSRDDILVVTDVNRQEISVDRFLAQPENRFTVERIRLSLPLYQTANGEKKGYQVNAAERPLTFSDIDGDGYLDLIVFLSKPDASIKDRIDNYKMAVYFGCQNGTFNAEAMTVNIPSHLNIPRSKLTFQKTADVNGDGSMDIVSLSQDGFIQTILGHQNGQVPSNNFIKGIKKEGNKTLFFPILPLKKYHMIKALYHQSQPSGYKLSQVQLVDLNLDGRADLLAIKNNGQYVILYAQEDGSFGDPVDPFATREDGRPVLAMYANPNGSFEIMPEEAQSAGGQKRVYANPLAIRADQHILGMTFASGKHKKEPRLLSLYADGTLSSHPFYIDVSPEKNYIGSGGKNDNITGQKNQKNIFEVREGTKNFTGGDDDDLFLIYVKKAPEVPGVLDGGEDKKKQNTIEIRLQPEGEEEYLIDLKKGRLAFGGSDKNIALLKNIHHAVGHYQGNDRMIGNDGNNILNGAGGRDHILGRAGNDVIMIAEGIAEGEEDDDVYVILQSRHNADLVIKETPLTEEASEDVSKRTGSVIKLMYRLDQIEAIDILQNGDIVGQLRNDNGTLTRMTLKEAYIEGKRQHNYILSSLDGFTWENFSEQSVNLLKFEVSYHPLKDALFQNRTQGMSPENIHIIQNRSENSVTVGKSRILLPSFMSLFIKDTGLNDILTGDEKSNHFVVSKGENLIRGQGGEDIYVILPGAVNQTIDNDDNAQSPAQDLLVLPFAASSTFKTEGQDLSIEDDPASSQQKVRIKNFMKGRQYQHLSLALHEQIFDLRIDGQGVYVDKRVNCTQGDDTIEVYHDSQVDGDRICGDDGNDHIFYFCEKNRTLSGGKGDDEIKVTSANHMISGDEGDDKIEGGTGDDTYCFKRGDGIDEITEQGGEDRLRLMGDIRADQVWLKKHLNHLKVIIGENGTDAVLFHGYFEGPEREIEQISLPSGNYLLKNYKAVMAEWSEDFYLSLDQLDRQHNDLQQKPALVADTQHPSLLPEAVSVFDTQEKSISPYAKIFSKIDQGALTVSA